MGRRVLDPTLMSKLTKRFGNTKENVNVMVSKKANKLGISAEAALIILAKENDIGTSTYQRTLDPSKQAEVRNALPSVIFPGAQTSVRASGMKSKSHTITVAKKNPFPEMIAYLIQDQQLRERCRDILLASSHFDRPIREATLILEDRIRKKSGLGRMNGDPLVGAAFNPELSKTLLRVASNDSDDQRGFTQIMRGIVPTFRNKTHHHITGKFTREDALRVCGFIDVLLRVVDESVKVR
jgi:uncharacterized protein (TIGR02391 family)